jgi:hypothetical protein
MRRHYGAQRQLLPLHELRVNERVQLGADEKWFLCTFGEESVG